MNILHITLGFYPAVGWGGPVTIVHQNGKELVRRGHQVTVYCSNLLNKKEKIEQGTFEREIDGMRVVYHDTWNIKNWPGTLGPIWQPNLGAYIGREIHNFDIIHFNGFRSVAILPVIQAAGRAGVPIVAQPHGSMQIIMNSIGLKKLYDRVLGKMVLKGIRGFIALSDQEKQQIIARGVPAEQVWIIPNGIDLQSPVQSMKRGEFRQRFGIAADKPLILFLGRINRKKGTDMLVEAFERLRKDVDANLAIVGPDDGQLSEVQSLVAQYNLKDRVFFPGLLSGDDVRQAYRDSDLFVLPCRTDTFPTTIMEAGQANLPMVITEGCEIANLVKDRVAEVTPFDADAFATAMRKLLVDKELYQTYQKNCPQVMCDTFSIQASVDKLEALYQRVIDEKGPSRL